MTTRDSSSNGFGAHSLTKPLATQSGQSVDRRAGLLGIRCRHHHAGSRQTVLAEPWLRHMEKTVPSAIGLTEFRPTLAAQWGDGNYCVRTA
jgi:hypothetical protein